MCIVRQELNIKYVYLQYGFKWLRRVFHVAATEMKDTLLLLLPQSFDWLTDFHRELLQAILFIAV